MKGFRVPDLLKRYKDQFNKADALACKIDGQWQKYHIDEYINIVNDISYALIHQGIKAGDKVAIVSPNRPEWNFIDMGVAQIGAVSVPIYPTISEADYKYIMNDAEVRIAFVADAELHRKISNIKVDVSSLMEIYTFDKVSEALHWSVFKTIGEQHPNPTQCMEMLDAIKPENLLTLIYTSGTTGVPKGVMLSHNNIMSNVTSAAKVCPVNNNHRILSFLPLSHIFERMLIYMYQYVGASIYYAESMDTIGDNLKEVKPFAFSTVPRLLEKVYDKIVGKGNELTGVKRKLFFWALDLGLRYELDGANGWWYEFQLKLANKIIFSKWREALGGEVGVIVSGAAALQPRLARVFTAAKINVLEGYGLTETSPVICVNRLDQGGRKFGTVGMTIEDVEVKIAEDGEILCKGPNVMMGYYNKPELTAEVIKNGWFHTGDIGVLEDGKYLKITDRKKEIFKTSGGKYVAPQVLENKFKESMFIEQVMVIGEGKKHPSAFLVPNFPYLEDWAKDEGISFSGREDLVKNTKVVEKYQSEVDHYNKGFGSFEQVKKFEIMPNEWGIDTGELTPTLKLRRKIIMEKYDALVKKIYDEN
jgi:long-chain acyl-CoA synthetase